MPISVPHQLFTYSIVLTPHCHKKMHFLHFIDYVIDYIGFYAYRQYFGHIMAVLHFKVLSIPQICNEWWPFSMSSKINRVHIYGIYNTTKVGNASFVIAGS